MAAIFLSYRRDDSAGYAGRLGASLEDLLGPGAVFRDVDAPRYEELLQGQVEQARAKNPPDLAEMIRGPETWEVV